MTEFYNILWKVERLRDGGIVGDTIRLVKRFGDQKSHSNGIPSYDYSDDQLKISYVFVKGRWRLEVDQVNPRQDKKNIRLLEALEYVPGDNVIPGTPIVRGNGQNFRVYDYKPNH